MAQEPSPRAYRNRKKRRAKRNRQISLLVMAVLVVLLFVTALLLAGGKGETSSASSGSASPITSASQQSSSVSVSAPAVESQPPSSSQLPQEPQREATPYDEEGIPPLFNYQNVIPKDYQFSLVAVGNNQSMDERAAAAFLDLVAAAKADGIAITPVSGYRSNETQTRIYENKLQLYRDQGLDEAEALRRTQEYHAIPGTSEHEVGLAMDVNWVDDGFAESEAYTWMVENCARFGFIYRYKAEWKGTTHIAWEPWHYRYVGANHAERIEEMNIPLEDYVTMLEKEAKALSH